MNWLNNLKDTISNHQSEVRGFIIGGTSGLISQPSFENWVQPVIISIICAIAGLFITHYGKKILHWIDKKLKL